MADTHYPDQTKPDPMIPGERDPSNLTPREPGAIGGSPSGADQRSQTGTIGGGGADAKIVKKRTTKKY